MAHLNAGGVEGGGPPGTRAGVPEAEEGYRAVAVAGHNAVLLRGRRVVLLLVDGPRLPGRNLHCCHHAVSRDTQGRRAAWAGRLMDNTQHPCAVDSSRWATKMSVQSCYPKARASTLDGIHRGPCLRSHTTYLATVSPTYSRATSHIE